ncbi:ABC transporter substrate-binding protein [Aliihoeflea sp. 40Bstr573]|uniref:ABC transporter substrate-binding protein n=1 Tax=Aliihoeflea sp. 40Bstr573 TaxID=2696467 RepID=UPI002095DDC0|nr:ABC transporter substrate-binding protein [Aliihoeflea sp. 40Bstr573]MCO6387032.1 ABC transporter substrate-binding protein [Aliihoeflea sp. 40Bstr573]
MLSITRRTFGALAAATMLMGAGAASAEPIKVGILSLTSHSPSIIAEGKGYFDEAGLEVEFVPFQAAQPMAVAIASGDVDFGLTAMTAGLVSLSERGAVKIIGGALQETAQIEGQKILVSKAAHEAGLTTPADLEGKRFGITTAGSSFHYMAHKIADKEGFERSTMELVPLNGVPAVIASLRSGQIDAWSIVPNIASGLVKSGDVFEIGSIAVYVEDYQVTTIFTSTEIAENNGELVEEFLAAFSKGADDYNAAFVDKTMSEEESAEIVAMIHEWVYTDRPLAEADPAIRAGAMRINENAKLNVASIEDQLEWFKSENLVPQDASIENLVDTSFVETF